MGHTGTTRRRVLTAASATAAGLLTACSSGSGDGPGSEAAARAESALRIRSAGTSRKLLVQYDAVLERHPGQKTRLAPLRAAVARQVAALAPRSRETRKSTNPSSAAPSASVTAAAPGSPAVAADPAQALKALGAAERRTADAHTTALMEAPPELARLLASVAAASAAHAYLLTEGPRS
nr:hypothetical protein OH820_26835 [Streptomyces sp. NBC_00857]